MLLFNLVVVHGVVFIVDFLEFPVLLELSQFFTIPSGPRFAFRFLLHCSLVAAGVEAGSGSRSFGSGNLRSEEKAG
ncbi:hypothetical protein GQ457_07G023270 [Hibiscus cannabinus]